MHSYAARIMKRRKCLGAEGLEQAPISNFNDSVSAQLPAPASSTEHRVRKPSPLPHAAPRDLSTTACRLSKACCNQAVANGTKCLCARSDAAQLTAIASLQHQQHELARHAATSSYLQSLPNSLALMAGPLLRPTPVLSDTVAATQLALLQHAARYRHYSSLLSNSAARVLSAAQLSQTPSSSSLHLSNALITAKAISQPSGSRPLVRIESLQNVPNVTIPECTSGTSAASKKCSSSFTVEALLATPTTR